jgi:hypothetical protein
MPLTENGKEIRSSLVKEYGHDRGRQVFYAMKNKGKITGVDDDTGKPTPVEQLVSECDSLISRMDAFEARQHQRKPVDVKPRTKDNMQPSNRHPKEIG